ncbi:MAG: dethiobiotin synthase [Cyclobacteriaceae bacterium]
MSQKGYFVSAIGTDSGKTLISAMLVEGLKADYWKPVQSGEPRDTESVRSLVSNSRSIFHPERHLLKTPASPHASARIDGLHISLDDFHLPESVHPLIVEGAGGLMVPLNDDDLIIDLIAVLGLPLILVSNLYLGSINHTLLSIEALIGRGIPIKGIIFNGTPSPESESVILHKSGLECLLRVPQLESVDKTTVQRYGQQLKEKLNGID